MAAEWVVLLEGIPTASSGELDKATLSRLLEAVADAHPVALHSSDRYAVQLKLTAEDPGDAVYSGLFRWKEAIVAVDAPRWEVVRAEVMTRAELDRESGHAVTDGRLGEAPLEAGDSDKSQRGGLAEQLLHEAFDDPITGLAGEGLLRDHLDRAVARGGRNGLHLAVLVVGLRAVRESVETLGTTFRNAALVVLADRLRHAISDHGVAGRIGDDHFVVLRQDCSQEEAVALCEQIVESMQAPITSIEPQIEAKVSVGIALSESGEDLLRNAVAALEMSQESSRNEAFAVFLHR